MSDFFNSVIDGLKWFFRYGDNLPGGEGAYTPIHLICVGVYMVSMVVLAIALGIWARKKSYSTKNKVLIWAAILIDGFELIKIVNTAVQGIMAVNSLSGLSSLLNVLPLFLCSIQLITIPLAAFTKGRIKEVALDFVCVFGILGAITGTVGAAQNYTYYPALSFPNVVSGITHAISGFASLYIMISGMVSLKWKNAFLSLGILFAFAFMAYGTNSLLEVYRGVGESPNYMFLMHHHGTPYSIFWDMVGGHPVIYPILVVLVFVVYLLIFFLVFNLIMGKKRKAAATQVEVCEDVAMQEAAATDASND